MPVKTEFSCIFQNISFCPFPERSKRRIFCNIYLENLVELLEVKLTELWGSPCDWVSLEFLTSRIVYTEPLAITVKVFLSWHSFPWQCLLLSLCFVNLCLHLLACLTLQSSVKQFAMCLSIAYGSIIIFLCFSFFKGVEMAKTGGEIKDTFQNVTSMLSHKTLVGLALKIVFQPVWVEWLNINKWRKLNLLLTLTHSILRKFMK